MSSSASSSGKRRFARIDRLPPYVFNITAELKLAARRRGEDIIDMSMGNPDGATPPHIVAKLTEVAQRPDTHGYSASKGIPRLRRAISHWYDRRYGVAIDPDSEAIVTIGSKEGLAHLMLATLDRGDTVLVPDPSYPIHIYGAVIAGADIRRHSGFVRRRLLRRAGEDDPRQLSQAEDDGLRLPLEPDRAVRGAGLLRARRRAGEEARHPGRPRPGLCRHRVRRLQAPSIMQVPGAKDVAVEFFTLSKSYNMAGWRVGFMVGNPDLVAALARIKSYHDYGTFTPLQVAAIAALEGDQGCVTEIAQTYQRRRDVLVKGLHEAGWMVDTPKASMYIWARIPPAHAALGSLEFSRQLLDKARVCVSPGIGFGDQGDGHVRFALIENESRIRQAVRGIKAMFKADAEAG